MNFSSILGLNGRFELSFPVNPRRGKKVAASKLITKRVLNRAGIPTPQLLAKFRTPEDIISFSWETLPSSFAFKPSRGLGGEGIIVVKKRAVDGSSWVSTQKKKITVNDLRLHALDMLEGAFSLGGVPGSGFCEEFVGRHKAFRKFAYRGTPDIRVVVFNRVPVMAMLRLPTKESGGRANLHQGAIGVGIDIATGITTHAIWHGKYIKYKPGTEKKLHGIKISHWTQILEIAVRCQEVSGLGYLGADIVLHPEKGPMVLELNSRPGLQIQLANKAGLKKRLERIEGLEVASSEHGVKIAKVLFAERFADRVAVREGIKTIGIWEQVAIIPKRKERVQVIAKIDTGAWRTSIDKKLAEKLGLLGQENVLWTKKVKSGLGQEERKVIYLTFVLAGRRIRTMASVANRGHLRTPVIIGRRDLIGFAINPQQNTSASWYQKLWKKN